MQPVAYLINGTPTPTATPTMTPLPTETPMPTETPLPTPTFPPAETEATADSAVAETTDEESAPVEPTATPTIVPTETPIPTPTATPLPWPGDVGSPLGSSNPSVSQFTLEQIGGRTPLDVLALLGWSGDTFAEELNVLRAQTAGYINDTTVQPESELTGPLPARPLFLVVGVMEGAADFNGQTGTMRVSVPWSPTLVEANLSSALLQQVGNPSLVINQWLNESGWVWMLARSAELENAMNNCRDSLPSLSNYRMPGGDCAPLQSLANENLPMDVVALLGIERDGTTLRPLLPTPTQNISQRWIYADFGTYSAQQVTAPNLTRILQSSDARDSYGLIRGTWNPAALTLSADYVLHANTIDGKTVYSILWKGQ